MKKLSLILVLALLLCPILAALPAGAEEPAYAADTVAVIGTREYSDLQDAFDAVQTGETIRLVKDLTDNKKTFTYSGTGYVKGETIARGRVTFDGSGHTISYRGGTGEANFALVFDANAIIEVKDLTVLSIRSAVKLTDGAQVTLRNCNLCAANTDYRSGTHDLNANKDFKGNIIKIDNDFRSFVEVDGGNYYGAASTGVDIRYGSIVVKGGTFRVWNTEVLLQVGDNTSEEGADLVRASGTILGGTFEASDYTAKFGKLIRAYKSATVTVWDGTFLQRSEGTKAAGSAVITGATSSSFGYVYIHGGTFFQYSSQPAAKLIGNNDLSGKGSIPAAKDKVFVYVTGGTFYSRAVEGRNKDDMTRTDGVLRYDDSVAKIEASTEDYQGVAMDKYTVTYQYSEAAPMPGAAAKVTNPDGRVYYTATLWEALNPYAKDGATVTLLADITSDHTLTVNNRSFTLTLDGNGKTLTSTAADCFNIQTGAVTVKNLTLSTAAGNAFRMGYLPAADEILTGSGFIASLTLKDVTVAAGELIAADSKTLFSGEAKLENVKLNGGDALNETRTLPVQATPDPDPEETTPEETTPEETTPEVTTPEESKPEESKPGATTETPKAPAGGCASGITGSLAVLLLAAAGTCALRNRKKKD